MFFQPSNAKLSTTYPKIIQLIISSKCLKKIDSALANLKLVSDIYYFFHQMIALQKL